jgi:hypothetical protein
LNLIRLAPSKGETAIVTVPSFCGVERFFFGLWIFGFGLCIQLNDAAGVHMSEIAIKKEATQ